MRFRWFCINMAFATAPDRARKEPLPDIKDISEQDISQYWDIITDMTPEEIDELFGQSSTRSKAEIVRDAISSFLDSNPYGSTTHLLELVNTELVAAGHDEVKYKHVWDRLRIEKKHRGMDTEK